MNTNNLIARAFLTLLAAIGVQQTTQAQLIDPAAEANLHPSNPAVHRTFNPTRSPGMTPEIINPRVIDAGKRADVRRVPTQVFEQIGHAKQSLPAATGVR